MEGTEKQIRYAEKLKEEFEKNHEIDCRMIDKLLESRAEVEKKFKAEGRNYEKEVIDFLKKYDSRTCGKGYAAWIAKTSDNAPEVINTLKSIVAEDRDARICGIY